MIHGVILLHKPAGVTSFQALAPLKRALKTQRIGHCGTLDLFASGLLVVLLGGMTKLNPLFSGLDKTYQAKFLFGQETDTLDPQGQIIKTCELPIPSWDLAPFKGDLWQVPPQYSAIHVGGKRASERMRDGEEVVLPPRPIHLYHYDVKGQLPEIDVTITCSSGTYVRSLARDFAAHHHSCATVTQLIRTWIGTWDVANPRGFDLHESVSYQDFDPNVHVMSAYQALQRLPQVKTSIVDEEYIPRILHGQPCRAQWINVQTSRPYIALFDQQHELVALVHNRYPLYPYMFVSQMEGA
jgi:tRNA pseudouridine55 synthase